MKNYKTSFIFFIFIIGSFLLRFIFISKGPYHHDTLEIVIKATQTLETLRLHYLHGPGYPLTVIFGAIFIKISTLFRINDPVFAINMLSVIFSTLCIILTYIFTKKLFNRNVGFFCALIFSFSPIFFIISTFGQTHNISIFFALLSFMLLLKFMETQKGKYLFLSGISLGLCAAARLSDLLIFIPFIYLYLTQYLQIKNKKIEINRKLFNIKNYSLLLLSIISPLIVLYLPMFKEVGINPILEASQSPFFGKFEGINLYRLYGFIGPIYNFYLNPVNTLFCLIGIYLLFKQSKKKCLFLLIWFLSLFLYYGNVSTRTSRYLILALLPLNIFTAYALNFFYTKRSYLIKISSCIIALLICATAFKEIHPLLSFHNKYALQVDFAHWVQKKTEPKAVIIAIDEKIFLDYYTNRETITRPVSCNKTKLKNYFAEKIDNILLKQKRPLYIIETAIGGKYYDPCNLFKKLLPKKYRVIYIGCRLNELWYHEFEVGVQIDTFKEKLFKIEPRL